MYSGITESVFIVLGFVFSAFYSCSEAVLMSIPIDRAKQLIAEGGSLGKALQFVAKRTNGILTTILIGNNLVNTFVAGLATRIASRYCENDALAISVGVTTILILIFGEVIPKTFGRKNAEQLALPTIRILKFNYYVFYPAVVVCCYMIKKILGKNAELSGRLVTSDDIEFMVEQAEKDKTIDSKQLDLLNSILEFPTIKVKDIMIPRNKVNYIRSDATYDEILKVLPFCNHSRYPVCEGGDLDKTVGFLHVKDLLPINAINIINKETFTIKKYLKTPFLVYEHMKIQAVFDHMNRRKVHLALVKDENGLVVGIVTLEDIIEEILGEIHDEHDKYSDGEKAERDGALLEEEGILVEGNILLRDLYNNYDIKIPLNDNYSTLTGFLLDNMGNHFPKKGMMVFWEGLVFKLEDVQNYEIKRVRISDAEGEKHIFSKKIENNNVLNESHGLYERNESDSDKSDSERDKDKDNDKDRDKK
ncbi:MAG: HlyC/CorC family transporter [Oligoflexia bacterium]|nr:HlyC/CorC family transporter [Oligoflexia bacterium]